MYSSQRRLRNVHPLLLNCFCSFDDGAILVVSSVVESPSTPRIEVVTGLVRAQTCIRIAHAQTMQFLPLEEYRGSEACATTATLSRRSRCPSSHALIAESLELEPLAGIGSHADGALLGRLFFT